MSENDLRHMTPMRPVACPVCHGQAYVMPDTANELLAEHQQLSAAKAEIARRDRAIAWQTETVCDIQNRLTITESKLRIEKQQFRSLESEFNAIQKQRDGNAALLEISYDDQKALKSKLAEAETKLKELKQL